MSVFCSLYDVHAKTVKSRLYHLKNGKYTINVAKIIQNIIGTHTLSTQSLYINLITASGWLTSISLMNI